MLVTKVLTVLKIGRTYRISLKDIKIDKIWQEYYYDLNHAQIAFCISFKFGAVGIVWDIRWVRAIMAWAWFSNLSLIRLFLIATSFSKSRAPPTPKKLKKKMIREKHHHGEEISGFFATQILHEINFGETRSSKNAVFAIFGLWILLIWSVLAF